MAELRVVFEGLEQEAETDIRERLLNFLKEQAEHVAVAWFGGSPNGAPNFDIDDVKGTAVVPPATAAAPSPAAVEPLDDKSPPTDTLPPAPVTAGIDPNTLGAPGPSL